MSRSKVSIRELQQNLKALIERVERGQVIEVTRRNRPVARLGPIPRVAAGSPWPDLEERTRAVFGDRMVSPSASDMVAEARGKR